MKLTLKDFSTMIIFGIPKSGKSNLIKNIVYNAAKSKYIDHCVLFSATKDKEDYDYIDDKYKYSALNMEVLQKYVEICKENNKREIVFKSLIILDDVLGEMSLNNDFFINLFSTYRHYGINVIIASQAIIGIPPRIRSMVSYGCVFKYINMDDLDKIYTCFGSLCKNKKDFIEMYNKYTNEPYKFFCFFQTGMFSSENAYCGLRAKNLSNKKFKIES